MSEGDFSQERKTLIEKPSVCQCYMTFLQHLLFPRESFEEDLTPQENLVPPLIFRELESIFTPRKKFEELERSFTQIFSRKKGKKIISPEEKMVLERWYGLLDGKPYYGVIEGSQRLAKESKMKLNRVSRILNRAFIKLRQPENFNLLPPEAKKLARI